MRILLVRHGQTPANVIGSLETATPGPGLTELGTEQADAVVAALAHEPISAIYVSKLRRTHETAAPLASALGLTPVELPGTHEIEAGDLEGLTAHDAVRTYMGTAFAWGSGDFTPRMPGGSDGAEFFERFDSSIAQVVADHPADATVVVVSHGAAIRVWTAQRVANLGDGFTSDNHLANTGVVVIESTGDTSTAASAWTALSWADLPLGGARLDDPTADDPTGEALDEALDDD
jgi:broad specificity phosphatase PhoE